MFLDLLKKTFLRTFFFNLFLLFDNFKIYLNQLKIYIYSQQNTPMDQDTILKKLATQ